MDQVALCHFRPSLGCVSSRSVPFPGAVITGSTCSNNHRQISFACSPPPLTTARGGRLADRRRDNPLFLRLWQARRGDPPPPVSTPHPDPQSHRFRRRHLQGEDQRRRRRRKARDSMGTIPHPGGGGSATPICSRGGTRASSDRWGSGRPRPPTRTRKGRRRSWRTMLLAGYPFPPSTTTTTTLTLSSIYLRPPHSIQGSGSLARTRHGQYGDSFESPPASGSDESRQQEQVIFGGDRTQKFK